MAPLRCVAALASVACCWAGSSVGGDRSVKQVVDTLRNLRASLEDAARKAEALNAEVSSQCDAALRRQGGRDSDEFSGPRVASLKVALEEQEAAVEESEGNAEQVRTNIALVEHTLRKVRELRGANGTLDTSLLALPSTKGDAGLVTSMESNKQMTLMSLQGELEVLMPAIAQLRERKTETARRLEARTRTSASSGRFLAAVRESCAQSSSRAAAQSAPRANEQSLIDAAATALQQLASVAGAAQAGAEEVSFVQLTGAKVRRHDAAGAQQDEEDDDDADDDDNSGSEDQRQDENSAQAKKDAEAVEEDTDDGLDAIFSSDDSRPDTQADAPKAAPAVSAKAPPKEADDAEEEEEQVDSVGPAAPQADSELQTATPHSDGAMLSVGQTVKGLDSTVQRLLAEVKSAGSADNDDREWCLEERARTKLATRLATDTTTALANEMAEHTEMEAEITEDLAKLNNASSEVELTTKDISSGLAKQKSFVDSRTREIVLATRILSQAMHILSDLQSAGQGADANADVQKLFSAAVDSLRQANTFFAEEEKVHKAAVQELAEAAKQVDQSASDCSSDLAAERSQLDFARDAHTSARAHAEENKRRYDDDMEEVSKYAADLEKTCGQDALKAGAQEDTAESQALEDAETVLQGKDIAAPVAQASSGASGLRGAASAKDKDAGAKLENLSPLERAAAEMGVAIN